MRVLVSHPAICQLLFIDGISFLHSVAVKQNYPYRKVRLDVWSGRLFHLNARAPNDSVRTHCGHLVQHTVHYGQGQRFGMGIMPLAMKVPFHQTTRCHTATYHVLTEILLLLQAVLITYDPEEVAGYCLPGLL